MSYATSSFKISGKNEYLDSIGEYNVHGRNFAIDKIRGNKLSKNKNNIPKNFFGCFRRLSAKACRDSAAIFRFLSASMVCTFR